MVHGDISPTNLLVTEAREARAVLVDFGLATWLGAPPLDAGPFRGTLAYAAPETARGEPLDGRADDFALAASLLHAATDVPLRAVPVEGAGAAALFDAGSRALDASHPWRTQAHALFDGRLADALLACLAFDPRDRPRETPRPW
jgi:serine/threonine protein kinase